jgi:hypothetical protein
VVSVLEGGKVGFSSPGGGSTRLGPSEVEGTSLGVVGKGLRCFGLRG